MFLCVRLDLARHRRREQNSYATEGLNLSNFWPIGTNKDGMHFSFFPSPLPLRMAGIRRPGFAALALSILVAATAVLPPSVVAAPSSGKTKQTPVAKSPVKRTTLRKSSVKASKSSPVKVRAGAKKTVTPRTPVARARYSGRNKIALLKTTYSRYRQRLSPYAGHWTVPNFADATEGDVIDGEDLEVRRAAVAALNGLNGTVVVADPSNGRILSIVNQKLAMQNGFQPCSTVKILASVAGVMEGQYTKDKVQKLGRHAYMNMTEALARSNNPYFMNIGRKLGYEKISYYAKLLGYGELAGLNIPGEQPGIWPEREVSSGIGMMTSFGDGIHLTPLQLASQLVMIANGGTMYYLQYPRTQAEIETFVPQVKRKIANIDGAIAEVKPGMQGAIEFGSARRAGYEDHEPIFGKTGTCTHNDHQTHLGWFGSFNEIGDRKLVVVVLLTGGKLVSGPVASGVAGQVFLKLRQNQYFASGPALWSAGAMASASNSLQPEN